MIKSLSSPNFCNHTQNKSLVSCLDKIDKYLYGHPQLLTKRLIFFVVNQEREHWFGFCAVNPWLAILKQHVEQDSNEPTPRLHADFTKKKFEQHQSGLLYNDGLHCRATKPDDISPVLPFIWLLNMMSHYRDLLVTGEQQKINFVLAHKKDNHCALHMYFLGTHGPFGNFFVTTYPRCRTSSLFGPQSW